MDNTENINSQTPMDQDVPQQIQENKAKKGLIIGIVLGVLLLAAIIIALLLLISPASGSKMQERDPQPLLYLQDDEAYLAVGSRTVELEGAVVMDSEYGYDKVNSQISFDNRYFIYLANVEEDTGAGDLMLIDLKGDLEPERIEEEVCSASLSDLGNYIMFFKDIEDGVGTLYHGKVGEEAEEIAYNVLPLDFAMSSNGKNFYYNAQQNDDTWGMYICKNGEEPEKVKEADFANGEIIDGLNITDAGVFLFSYEEDGQRKIYTYENGDEEKYAGDIFMEMVIDAEKYEMIYSEGDSLYYKTMGEDKERITNNLHGIMYDYYFGPDPYHVYEPHFLLAESKGEDDSGEVTLFEIEVGGEPIEIADADTWSYSVNSDFKWVSFKRDNKLFLVNKMGNEWGDRIELCEYSRQPNFGDNGKYFYYIELNDPTDEYGDLYRFELNSAKNEPELMQYDVSGYYMCSGSIVTRANDDEIYRVDSKDDKKLLFDEKIYDLDYAPNGLYLYTKANNYDIFYITLDGEEEEVCYDATNFLKIDTYITHNVVETVPKDMIDDLSKLYQDVKFIQAVLSGDDVPSDISTYKELGQHLTDLRRFVERDDLGDEALAMVLNYYYGFEQLKEYFGTDEGSDEERQAVEAMNKYFDKAGELFEKLVGESTVDPLY